MVLLRIQVTHDFRVDFLLSFSQVHNSFLLLLDVLAVLSVDALDGRDLGFNHLLFVFEVELAFGFSL